MKNPDRLNGALWQTVFFLELWAFIRLAGSAGYAVLELVLAQLALSVSCLMLAAEISAALRRRAYRSRG